MYLWFCIYLKIKTLRRNESICFCRQFIDGACICRLQNILFPLKCYTRSLFVPPAFDFQHERLIELITVVMRWIVCIHAHHKVKYMTRPKIGPENGASRPQFNLQDMQWLTCSRNRVFMTLGTLSWKMAFVAQDKLQFFRSYENSVLVIFLTLNLSVFDAHLHKLFALSARRGSAYMTAVKHPLYSPSLLSAPLFQSWKALLIMLYRL